MNHIAIYSSQGAITYQELSRLVNCKVPIPVFFAHPTLDTIVNILSCIQHKIPFYPISPREPFLPKVPPCPDLICSCLMTSGTKSAKFAAHTWENHYISAMHPHPDLKLTSQDCWLLSLPLSHIGGLAILFRCYLHGAAIILPDGDRSLATIASFVPTQLKRYLFDPYPLPHIRALLIGGAPIPESLCQVAHAKGLTIYLSYGMTEMSSQITTKAYQKDHGVNMGFPLPHREIQIQPDGEIWVRGKTLFAGYQNLPTPMEDGWFNTNDIGQMGEHGLILKGRKDNMIISGGENIHLEEIEASFMNLPEVIQVQVSKRPDPEYGERPIAKIALKEGIRPKDIHDKLQQFLPKFKIPSLDDLILVDEIKGKNF